MKIIVALAIALVFAPAALRAAAPAAPAATAAAPAKVEGYTFVRTVSEISEYTLDSNGLSVLLMPEHSAPVITYMITYRVGSRNEVTGTTGSTHLLEHLMFKGTDKYLRSKGTSVDQLLETTGALYNATTWNDRTNYYENLGSEHLPLVVEMTADHMRNLLLLESDRQPEMTVVRNEFERGENDPVNALGKEIWAAAFQAHPYHHDTIGWRSDIEKVPIGKLREFYDTFYWPNNATISVIGDFDPVVALELIKKFNSPIPRSPKPIPQVYTEEPEQSGPRRVTLKRAGQVGVVAIAHKIPAGTNPDFPAIGVLSAILTEGKNSRLYKALTDKNLTLNVRADAGFNHDPSLLIIDATLAPGASHDEVEKITLAEIEKLKKDGVTETEVQAAIAKTLSDAAFRRDGSFAIAGTLNEAIASGDWTTFYSLEEGTKAVKAADVQRVANKYLNADQSTTGWFIPNVTGAAAPIKAKAGSSLMEFGPRPNFHRDPEIFGERPSLADPVGAGEAPAIGGGVAPATKISPNIVRAKIAGLDVLVYKTGVKDVITLKASLPAGRAFGAGGNPAIPALTGQMLDQGTTKQDKFAIAQKLEAVGARISFSVGTQTVDVSAKCLAKDIPLVLSLIAEQLRSPAFPAEEFAKVKKQAAGALKRRLESTDFRAADAFSRAIYPVGHPNRNPAPEELLAAIESATLDQVKAFYAKYYGPAHLVMVVVGDVDAKQIQGDVAKDFSGWSGGVGPAAVPKLVAAGGSKDQNVMIPDKTSVSLVVGQPSGLRYQDPDYQALRVATAILGSGFTGRLMANVRDKEGLTYGIGAGLANDTFIDGDWGIFATFSPTLLDKGLASTQRQLTKWYADGATAEEVTNRKSNLIGSFKVGLATTDGLAATILNTVNRGFELTWLDEYPAKIDALTPEQVNAAIKKYLKPENMVIIKAGTILVTVPAPK